MFNRNECFVIGIGIGLALMMLLNFSMMGSLFLVEKIESHKLTADEIIATVSDITKIRNDAVNQTIALAEENYNLTEKNAKLQNTSYYYQYQRTEKQLQTEIANNPDYVLITYFVVIMDSVLTMGLVYFIINREQTKRVWNQKKTIDDLQKEKEKDDNDLNNIRYLVYSLMMKKELTTYQSKTVDEIINEFK